jgi:hypothetical protein
MNSELSTLAFGMSRRDFLQRASAAAIAASAMPEYALGKEMSREETSAQSLWDLAQKSKDLLTLAVWFTAQDVNEFLSNDDGMKDAISWCKQNGGTKVSLEAFGRGSYADRQTLLGAKTRFLREGLPITISSPFIPCCCSAFAPRAVPSARRICGWTGWMRTPASLTCATKMTMRNIKPD